MRRPSNRGRGSWRTALQVGQLLDACDTDRKWYESRVLELSAKRVKVHYRGWTAKWDEWLDRMSPRLAPLHSKVPNWRDFHVGDDVMVGRAVANRSYPEWRNARVTACEPSADGSLRIEVEVDGVKQRMDAQDEMLCPPGTHQAYNGAFGRKNQYPASKQVGAINKKLSEGDEWCLLAETSDSGRCSGHQAVESDAGDTNGDERKNNGEENGVDEAFGADAAGNSTGAGVQPAQSEGDGSQTPVWRAQLRVGQLVDALDTDKKWYESRVVELTDTRVKVHYRGWTHKWDQWLDRASSHLAPMHTKMPNWREFGVDDAVMVGRTLPSKSYPEWRNARVTAVKFADGSCTQIEVDVDGSKRWLNAQDELLCQPGTHKAANGATTAVSLASSSSTTSSGSGSSSLSSSDQRCEACLACEPDVASDDEWCVVADHTDSEDLVGDIGAAASDEEEGSRAETPSGGDTDAQVVSGCDTESKDVQADSENKSCANEGGQRVLNSEHPRTQATDPEQTWRWELRIGQLLDALDTDKKWYESRVVDLDAQRVKVHFRGWTRKWDEWLDRQSRRVAPLHTKVPDWRAFQVGDNVMVGKVVPTKSYPVWQNARVSALGSTKAEDALLIQVDVGGNTQWMSAQDELLCPPGTHKVATDVGTYCPSCGQTERGQHGKASPSKWGAHLN